MPIRSLSTLSAGLFVMVLASASVNAVMQPSSNDEIAQPGGTVPKAEGLALVKVADGFIDPVNVANAGDGSGRVFVVERAGKIQLVRKDGTRADKPFVDFTRYGASVISPTGGFIQSQFIEQGLYSVAFHPQFDENGYFFIHYASVRLNGSGVIARFQVDPDSPDHVSLDRIAATEKQILTISQPSYNNNGGQIAFGPDGLLYVGVGDGGWKSPRDAGQDTSLMLGSILRIDVDTADNVAYKIPPNNPLVGKPGRVYQEIWVNGFHNPYEFAFDPKSGALFVTDVGDSHFEEVNYIAPGHTGGANFGWPRMEGASCYPIHGAGSKAKCDVTGRLPVAVYAHPKAGKAPEANGSSFVCSSAQGLGVANYAGMNSVYLLADWCTGEVFGTGWDGERWQLEELLETSLHITAGGQDEAGYVLAVSAKFYDQNDNRASVPGGALWRFVPLSQVPAGVEKAPLKQ